MDIAAIARRFKVILWDFDETLTRRPDMWCTCLAQACQMVGETTVTPATFDETAYLHLPWNRRELSHTAAESADQWWAEFFSLIEPLVVEQIEDGSRVDEIFRIVRRLAADPTRYEVLSKSDVIVTRLHALLVEQAIVSNHIPELGDVVAELFPGRFSNVWTSGRIGFEKPRPEFFAYVTDRLSVSPREVLFVGDDEYRDLVPAQAHGMEAVHIETLHSWLG